MITITIVESTDSPADLAKARTVSDVVIHMKSLSWNDEDPPEVEYVTGFTEALPEDLIEAICGVWSPEEDAPTP